MLVHRKTANKQGLSYIGTSEEFINEEFVPDYMKGCRRFRIEYVNREGFSNFEGVIYVPENEDVYPLLDELTNKLEKLFGVGTVTETIEENTDTSK